MAKSARPLAIIDVDGVVADVRHRLKYVEQKPKDWDAFFEAAVKDPPHAEGVDLVRSLSASHDIVYLTGRPERCRADTEKWLERNGIGGWPVIMRGGNDRRPAAVVKVGHLRKLSRTHDIAVVVDDDALVLKAVEKEGFPVHVADWERRAIEDDVALLEAQEVEGRT